MVALLIGLWILIFAPLALAPFLLAGDTDGLTGPARQPADTVLDQPREVARLGHMQPPHTHGRAA